MIAIKLIMKHCTVLVIVHCTCTDETINNDWLTIALLGFGVVEIQSARRSRGSSRLNATQLNRANNINNET